MKALSIKQPWAWLIVSGQKDIENRTWSTSFTGRIYVHAAIVGDSKVYTWLNKAMKDFRLPLFEIVAPLRHGAIVGEVDIIDCVTESESEWFTGPYGFVLANPEMYIKPIPCGGQLRFFEPKI